MNLENIDYKSIVFTRSDGINVSLKVNLNNPSDLDEDMLVFSVDGINKPSESKLFYWINKKRFTLNEFIFFALNNDLCMKILDKAGTEIASHGNCSISARIFNSIFGENFN